MLETPRVRCEPLVPAHAEAMFPLLTSDEQIYAYLREAPPASLDDLRRRYEVLAGGTSPDGAAHWLNWIVFLRTTGRPIGYVQATVKPPACSIGYVMHPSFWGKGYAVESAEAMIRHVFRAYDIGAVTAEINPRNTRSVALVRRLGFTFLRHDAAEDDDIFEMTRAAWAERPTSSPGCHRCPS